jgi:GrpB-like predicted nucleotidyltransferase (UPF0157 family)
MPQLEISDYDVDWPTLYEIERGRILGVLPDAVGAVEHIGSTAVRGLSAKPVIDILIGLKEGPLSSDQVADLRRIGYRRIRVRTNRIYFRKIEAPRSFLHVVEFGGRAWNRYLIFRDYLRSHPDEAEVYSALKRRLISDRIRGKYAREKRTYIDAIVGRSRAERRRRVASLERRSERKPQRESNPRATKVQSQSRLD